jgi:hypothetical protein
MSDLVLIDTIGPDVRHLADRMLAGEISRQERLKAQLGKDKTAAAWTEKAHLFQNYKQLQFFDTLALYFNRSHESARGEATFKHVPRSAADDVTVELRPLGGRTYGLSPYPFEKPEMEFSFSGRPVWPMKPGSNARWESILASTPHQSQTFKLVAR